MVKSVRWPLASRAGEQSVVHRGRSPHNWPPRAFEDRSTVLESGVTFSGGGRLSAAQQALWTIAHQRTLAPARKTRRSSRQRALATAPPLAAPPLADPPLAARPSPPRPSPTRPSPTRPSPPRPSPTRPSPSSRGGSRRGAGRCSGPGARAVRWGWFVGGGSCGGGVERAAPAVMTLRSQARCAGAPSSRHGTRSGRTIGRSCLHSRSAGRAAAPRWTTPPRRLAQPGPRRELVAPRRVAASDHDNALLASLSTLRASLTFAPLVCRVAGWCRGRDGRGRTRVGVRAHHWPLDRPAPRCHRGGGSRSGSGRRSGPGLRPSGGGDLEAAGLAEGVLCGLRPR